MHVYIIQTRKRRGLHDGQMQNMLQQAHTNAHTDTKKENTSGYNKCTCMHANARIPQDAVRCDHKHECIFAGANTHTQPIVIVCRRRRRRFYRGKENRAKSANYFAIYVSSRTCTRKPSTGTLCPYICIYIVYIEAMRATCSAFCRKIIFAAAAAHM